MDKTQKFTVSLLVENEFGALTRIAALFSGRAYNIDSLTVAPTLEPELSRMTINTFATEAGIEQILKQLNKLVNVIRVKTVKVSDAIVKNLLLVKVNLGSKNKEQLEELMQEFDYKIVEQNEHTTVVSIVIDDNQEKDLVKKLDPHGIIEYVSTGAVSMARGKNVLKV